MSAYPPLRSPVAPAPSPLSPRETELARLVAEGLTNRQIAGRLVISERTVQNHIQHILRKLDFATRSQIAVWSTLTDGHDEWRDG
jgi:DNA-binding NarL/FixJ family response regulator